MKLKWLSIELFGPSCVHSNQRLQTQYLMMMMIITRKSFARKFTSIEIYKIIYIILCIMYFLSTTAY